MALPRHTDCRGGGGRHHRREQGQERACRHEALVDPTPPRPSHVQFRDKGAAFSRSRTPTLGIKGVIRKLYFKDPKERIFSQIFPAVHHSKFSPFFFFPEDNNPQPPQCQYDSCISVYTVQNVHFCACDVIFLATFGKHTIKLFLCSPRPHLLVVSANNISCPARDQEASRKCSGGRNVQVSFMQDSRKVLVPLSSKTNVNCKGS